MAIAVSGPPAVKIAGNVEGADVTRAVRNVGANTAYVARDPAVTSTSGFEVRAGETSPAVSLAPGEELYAVCATGLTTSVETI